MNLFDLITFLGLYYSMLAAIWIYSLLYSIRHNIDSPSGFGIVLIGGILSGEAITFWNNNYQIAFSIHVSFLISLFGIFLNITNIRRQFDIGSAKKFLWFSGIGLFVGLLLGFCALALIGTNIYMAGAHFTAVAIIASATQTSITEEILERGYSLNYLQKYGVKPTFAIVFQSLMFMVAHIPKYFDNWMMLFVTFLVGFTGGCLTWKSKNLIPTIILHTAFNLVGIIWWLTVK
jgi:membrane protease YdiL (CAAX protease family)